MWRQAAVSHVGTPSVGHVSRQDTCANAENKSTQEDVNLRDGNWDGVFVLIEVGAALISETKVLS